MQTPHGILERFEGFLAQELENGGLWEDSTSIRVAIGQRAVFIDNVEDMTVIKMNARCWL